MIQDILYFAYGSNMSSRRLKNRVESANVISTGILEKYKLKFHKISEDGSGKCDAYFTNVLNDKINGVIYSIHEKDLDKLDDCEGLDKGYTKALKEDKNFLAGLNIFKGQVTYKAVADVFGYKYVSPSEALTN